MDIDIKALIVENNLRADLPDIFGDDVDAVMCGIVMYFRMPQIGGQLRTYIEIAKLIGTSPGWVSEQIGRWQASGTWSRVMSELVKRMEAEIQIADMSVLAHYPQVIKKVLDLIADPKVSPRTRLDAMIFYFNDLVVRAEKGVATEDNSLDLYLAQATTIYAPSPDVQETDS